MCGLKDNIRLSIKGDGARTKSFTDGLLMVSSSKVAWRLAMLDDGLGGILIFIRPWIADKDIGDRAKA